MANCWYGPHPKCDICRVDPDFLFFDARTKRGPWAVLCPDCFAVSGIGLGLGLGQAYNATTHKKISIEDPRVILERRKLLLIEQQAKLTSANLESVEWILDMLPSSSSIGCCRECAEGSSVDYPCDGTCSCHDENRT